MCFKILHKFLQFWSFIFINLPWGRVRSDTKFGSDRFSRFDVYWIQTNRQTTDKSNLYIDRKGYDFLTYQIVFWCINHSSTHSFCAPLKKLHDPIRYNMYCTCILVYCPVWTTRCWVDPCTFYATRVPGKMCTGVVCIVHPCLIRVIQAANETIVVFRKWTFFYIYIFINRFSNLNFVESKKWFIIFLFRVGQ